MTQPSIDSTLNSQPLNKARFNLDGYFKRIGYAESTDVSLETLRAIHLRHAQSIPFENLNPFLRIPVVLDIDSLYQKLVLDRRGGYAVYNDCSILIPNKKINPVNDCEGHKI